MTCVTPANDHTYFAKKDQLFPCLQEDSGIPTEAGSSSSSSRTSTAAATTSSVERDGGVKNMDKDFYGGATEGREGGRSMEGKWSRRMRGEQEASSFVESIRRNHRRDINVSLAGQLLLVTQVGSIDARGEGRGDEGRPTKKSTTRFNDFGGSKVRELIDFISTHQEPSAASLSRAQSAIVVVRVCGNTTTPPNLIVAQSASKQYNANEQELSNQKQVKRTSNRQLRRNIQLPE
ncbi:hypothetical protein PRIPAC_72661 [Pristionchus pacificus]|uniref:Uncharacterized protein n=1 Tax=Pristionchus pacificus TaxID=54126 RepID=A0A2A6C965_PRIPA|nr:hypothetical protein PRIPAC_72661 [Pristionchus pacificus]|eukprot:PDM74618.1 hypothetical protein PRIPAC_41974 [Pristionchus pacificus]